MTQVLQIAAVLHDVRSVHNVGSIFRTADAAGVHAIYLCGITPTPLDRFKEVRQDFAKVSLGAEKTVAWKHVSETAAAITELRKSGYEIFAIEQSKKSVPYYSLRKKNIGAKKIALMVGNEVEGIPQPLLALCDGILEIPMRGEKESLNVSVAFGVVAFNLRDRV
ncbi:MAG TPA: TrmH family RNA methyltransferase [Candidatus Paceibacterota bacterium]|nr:TrmH family RNA methyltransferase [Candidatus Paceibacterota bacterium]